MMPQVPDSNRVWNTRSRLSVVEGRAEPANTTDRPPSCHREGFGRGRAAGGRPPSVGEPGTVSRTGKVNQATHPEHGRPIHPPDRHPDAPRSPDGSPEPPPLRSVHTANLAGILSQLGVSLLVTTYQAGKLVMV